MLQRIFAQASNDYTKWPSYTEITTAASTILGESITTYVMSCNKCEEAYANKASGSQMTVSVQYQYIPALDLLSCVSCNSLTKCAKCDYFHTTNKVRRKDRAYEGADASNYALFCLECLYTTSEVRVISLKAATGCISASSITDCAVHFG